MMMGVTMKKMKKILMAIILILCVSGAQSAEGSQSLKKAHITIPQDDGHQQDGGNEQNGGNQQGDIFVTNDTKNQGNKDEEDSNGWAETFEWAETFFQGVNFLADKTRSVAATIADKKFTRHNKRVVRKKNSNVQPDTEKEREKAEKKAKERAHEIALNKMALKKMALNKKSIEELKKQ